MTISVKHAFQSAKADGSDASLVRPSNWNAEHTITMATARLIGRSTAGTGAIEEISLGTGLQFSGTSLILDTTVAGNPAGTVIWYAKNSAPTGYLKANGAAVSRATYAALFTAIGTTFGAGDGSTTFNVPDLRGEFIRGWDDARGVDSGRAIGTAQAANIASHTHSVDPPSTATTSYDHTHTYSNTTAGAGAHSDVVNVSSNATMGTAAVQGSGGGGSTGTVPAGAVGDHAHTYSGGTTWDTHNHTVDIAPFTSGAAGSGTDTRPRNVALLACIKF